MNPKAVFRCVLISLLLAAPAPLVLAAMVHVTDGFLAEQWLGAVAVSGVLGSYLTVAFGVFLLLLVATLTVSIMAPAPMAEARVVPQKSGPDQVPGQADTHLQNEQWDDDDTIDPNDGREEGEVKWFNTNKGYGFITRDNGDDVFVHFRAIRGRGNRMLTEGQIVRYHVIKNERGLQADDVSIIE
ncbi:cold shock domain-containing protein [Halomonas sp. Bachu 37]|uniref:cold-shock protein n=1 Tax=Halomonas kashgarensis TaxID=3084920 RepID=UPI00321801B1